MINKRVKDITLLLMGLLLLHPAGGVASDGNGNGNGNEDHIEWPGESDLRVFKTVSDEGVEAAAYSDATKLLTTLPLQNGSLLEFWEVSDGDIIIAEGGRYPAAPSLSKMVAEVNDVLEIYRRLAPPAAVLPEQLRRAAARETLMRQYLGAGEKLTLNAIASPVGSSMSNALSASVAPLAAVDTSKCPWSWFDNQFSLVTQGLADPDNWSYQQRTGSTSYLNGRMSIVLASACSYRGNVRFSFWSKATSTQIWLYDSPTFTRVVHEGEWYWVMSRAEWWWQNARDIYSEVSYAGGDGYHHKGVGCDRKAFSQCAVNAPNGNGYWGE